MSDELVQRLRGEGEWPETQKVGELFFEAADEIERLRKCLRYEQYRFATQSTHSEICHTWGPLHYECALRELESAEHERDESRAENARLLAELVALREAQSYNQDVMQTTAAELVALSEKIGSAQPAEVLDDFDQMGNRCGIIYVETAQIGKHVRLVVEE